MQIEIVNLPLSALTDCPDNPRVNYSGVEALAESIRLTGQKKPLLVEKTDAGFMILQGHRRARALRILGRDTAACTIVSPDNAAARWSIIFDHDSEGLTTDYELARLTRGLLDSGSTLENLKITLRSLLDKRFPVSDATRKRWSEADNPAKAESMFRNGTAQYLAGIASPFGLDYWRKVHAGEALPTYTTADWRAVAGAVAKDDKHRVKGRKVYDHVENKGPALTETLEKIDKRITDKEAKGETIRSRPSKEILALTDTMEDCPVKAALLWAAGAVDEMPEA